MNKRQFQAVFMEHIRPLNPWVDDDVRKEENWAIFWEICACIGIVLFFLWLAYLPHGGR